jgi:hypothetical protein
LGFMGEVRRKAERRSKRTAKTWAQKKMVGPYWSWVSIESPTGRLPEKPLVSMVSDLCNGPERGGQCMHIR